MARGIAGRKGVGTRLVYCIRFGPTRFGGMRFPVSARAIGLAALTADVALRGVRRLIVLLLGPEAGPSPLSAHLIVSIGHVRPLFFSASVGLPSDPIRKHGLAVCPAPTRVGRFRDEVRLEVRPNGKQLGGGWEHGRFVRCRH
jgi:hypothetical protein